MFSLITADDTWTLHYEVSPLWRILGEKIQHATGIAGS
jgi:hypothetical protein